MRIVEWVKMAILSLACVQRYSTRQLDAMQI